MLVQYDVLFCLMSACEKKKWGKSGDYDLAVADAAARAFTGSAVAAPAEWQRLRAFTGR